MQNQDALNTDTKKPRMNGGGQTYLSSVIEKGHRPDLQSSICAERLNQAKKSFVTRRCHLPPTAKFKRLKSAPRSGDLVLAKVTSLGQHKRLELVDGRRAHLHIGDEIITAFGERYAADQFHSVLPKNLSECELVAAGGIASRVVEKSSKVRNATRILPIGYIVDHQNVIINVEHFSLPLKLSPRTESCANSTQIGSPSIIVVAGSSMNAGKTATAANIVNCFKRQGVRVGACKATGTGAGGDMWRLADAGAFKVLDFTDAGYASTYNISIENIETALRLLLGELSDAGAEVIVIEIADGLLQRETEALLKSRFLKSITDNIVFAAPDPIAASAGVEMLASWGYSPAAVSGSLTLSPLAVLEAKNAIKLPVLTNQDFEDGSAALVPLMRIVNTAFSVTKV